VRMWRRRLALLAGALFACTLSASFVSAQSTLHRIDPLVFTGLQMSLLLPVALILLLCFRRNAQTSLLIRQGLQGGMLLGLGFAGVALSLRSLGIVPATMLTACDGVLASAISWLILHRRPSTYTFLATLCMGAGAVLLWGIAPGLWQTDLVALGCELLFTLYAFHVERSGVTRGSMQQLWPFFGGLFGAVAAITLLLALCFGSWSSLRALTPPDAGLLVYTSLATVLIPIMILTLLQRFLSALSMAFLAVLEPLLCLSYATMQGVSLTLFGWIGVGCIVLSVLIQTRVAVHALPSFPVQIGVRDCSPR
jgi:drug/metabolite transporter (DMT)-like permease